MKKGDLGFFYHTGDEKQIVGIVEVIRESYPDPTDADKKFLAVDVKAIEPLPKPVTLAAIRAEPRLNEMALVKYSQAFGAAGHRRGMENRLSHGRQEG